MRLTIPIVMLVTALTACREDETQRVYDDANRIWTLKQLDGAPFPASATLTFPKAGEITGQGPCNRYFGAMKAAYPQFDTGPIGSTRLACPEMAAETAFLTALERATAAQLTDGTLTLSDTDGLSMIFNATD